MCDIGALHAAALLNDCNPDVRASAAQALGLTASGVEHHVEQVGWLLEDRHWRVRAEAAVTLAKSGKAGVAQAIVRLDHKDPGVRVAAVEVLGLHCQEEGAHDESKIILSKQAAKLLQDPYETVQQVAARALSRIGVEASSL
eukprot:gnl/MRDRNA2_/MRDRNA2_28219_c0_seq1.p1 gnl/MRDRNA2_/MRDRNA2_28219_c0~~gnl/MRDRNA2_/MRDRNA2_28219_c0_seq1.p1  ORF type:complete len:149 (-),score=36.96 gnl/MRDRNA2_/MRDRNA2_28219_c0_seq1:12-437(-)